MSNHLLFISIFHCCLIFLASANSSFRNFLSSSRNLAWNFEEDSKEILSDPMNSSYFSQKKFKKTFKFIHNNSKVVYIQLNFTKITSKTNFPLISLSDNIGYQQYDFKSFFAKKTIHYLEYKKIKSNSNEKILYLTIFNLFTNSEESDDFLEYFITMRKGNLWWSNFYEIWGNRDCKDNPLILHAHYINLEENYHFELKKGKMKYFYSNFKKKIKDSKLFIKNSELLVFLNVTVQIENEKKHSVFLNSASFYFFEKNLSFPDYYYDDDHLSFILFAPLNNKCDEISLDLTISSNEFKKSSEWNIAVILVILVQFLALMGLVLMSLCVYLRRRNKDANEKLTKEILNLYFPTSKFEFFNKNSNNSKQCVICLQEFIISDVCRELYCLHLFHENCLDNWILIHHTCPVCRKKYMKSILAQEKVIYLEKLKAMVVSSSRNSGQFTNHENIGFI